MPRMPRFIGRVAFFCAFGGWLALSSGARGGEPGGSSAPAGNEAAQIASRLERSLSWLLDVRLSASESSRFRKLVVEQWPTFPPSEQAEIRQLCDLDSLKRSLGGGQSHETFAADFVAMAREEKKPEQLIFLGALERSHRRAGRSPGAPAGPPVASESLKKSDPATIDQAADSLVDFVLFLESLSADDAKPVKVDAKVRAEARKSLRARWPKMTEDERARMIDLPEQMKAFSATWNSATPEARGFVKTALVPLIVKAMGGSPRQTEGVAQSPPPPLPPAESRPVQPPAGSPSQLVQAEEARQREMRVIKAQQMIMQANQKSFNSMMQTWQESMDRQAGRAHWEYR